MSQSYFEIGGVWLRNVAGEHDRPQQVLDWIDLLWKMVYGEVLR